MRDWQEHIRYCQVNMGVSSSADYWLNRRSWILVCMYTGCVSICCLFDLLLGFQVLTTPNHTNVETTVLDGQRDKSILSGGVVTFFLEVRLLIWRLMVRFPMPLSLPVWISTTALSKASCSHTMSMWCERLKIPWAGKSVGSGFLLTNCCLMVKTRLFRLIHDRQYKIFMKNERATFRKGSQRLVTECKNSYQLISLLPTYRYFILRKKEYAA